MISISPVPMSIVKILYSQVVFMSYMLKALVTPIDGIRINLKYCSNQPVILYIPGGGGYIVYYTRYPGDGQLVLGCESVYRNT